jgi:Zn-dependent membrane protease YugP
MGFFRPSRRFRAPRRYVEIRSAVLIVGIGLVIAGFIASITPLIWIGIIILGIDIFLRFLP